MGIKFLCHACNRKLNVKNFLAGKRGVCPHCGIGVDIPLESQSTASATPKNTATENAYVAASQPSPAPLAVPANGIGAAPAMATPAMATPARAAMATPAVVPMNAPSAAPGPLPTHPPIPTHSPTALATSAPPSPAAVPSPPAHPASSDVLAEAPNAVWYVRPPSGGQYGPASGDLMKKWITEGRVSADSLIWREDWPDWQLAAPLFPSLAAAGSKPTTSNGNSGNGNSGNGGGRAAYYSRRRNSNMMSGIFVVLLLLAAMVSLVVLAVVLAQS
jgi:hypothetical protein